MFYMVYGRIGLNSEVRARSVLMALSSLDKMLHLILGTGGGGAVSDFTGFEDIQ